MEPGEFHSHDGWHWQRLTDGSVRVRIERVVPGSPPGDVMVHTLDAASWASVVAHVSAHGDTSDAWAQAVAQAAGFHAGVLP